MRSASMTVFRRWAIMNAVRPVNSLWMAACIKLLVDKVQRAGRFIKDNERGVLAQSPGDGHALPFAMAEFLPPFADERVIPRGEPTGELVDACRVGGGTDLGLTGSRTSVANVIRQAGTEYDGLLGDDGDSVAQVSEGQPAERDSVQANFAATRLVKAHQQLDQRCLAAASRSHDRDLHSGLNVKAYIAKHRLAVAIGEADPVEFDAAAHRSQCAGRCKAPGSGTPSRISPRRSTLAPVCSNSDTRLARRSMGPNKSAPSAAMDSTAPGVKRPSRASMAAMANTSAVPIPVSVTFKLDRAALDALPGGRARRELHRSDRRIRRPRRPRGPMPGLPKCHRSSP